MAHQIGIVGGHGQIARHLSSKLVARGHLVRGLVRSDDQFDDLRDDGAEPVLCDVESATESEIDDALDGCTVVVFAAGAGPDSGAARKLTLDRDGAIKSVEAAARIGARRFVIISSMGADDPPDDDEVFSVYLRAKRDADEAVRTTATASDLGYTIVRPGRLTDDDSIGRVQVADHAERSEIPRVDVAELVAELIDSGRGNGATFEVVSGPDPIADAVGALD